MEFYDVSFNVCSNCKKRMGSIICDRFIRINECMLRKAKHMKKTPVFEIEMHIDAIRHANCPRFIIHAQMMSTSSEISKQTQ